ncbi:MAG: patatin family protein [Oscillospiraceae bacterium]|nr:patatin family protein [Oscillospiraceae bacterium]
MKSVMMLEGGSYRGIYTSGILDVFMAHEVYPDCVVGVSAGALNGMGYVAKQPGRCRDVVMSYGMDPRYVGTKALRREHNLVGFDFILREMQEILPFDEGTFYHSGIKYYATATNCDTGRQEYFDRDESEDILTAVAASSSMQYLCRKVQIGEHPYLDGGIGPHLPLRFLKLHPEYDRVVVILTRRLEYRKHPVRPVMENLSRRLYRDYPNLLSVLLTEPERYAAERKELAELREQGNIFLIEPETELDIGKLERDKSKLQAGYEQGRRDGEKYWEQVKEYLQGGNGS